MAPSVTVIIPTYYRYDCLEVILAALCQQTYKLHEVLIVDQTPFEKRPKGFYERYASLPIVVVDLEQPSLTVSRNLGANAATGELLLFLDDDMVVTPLLVEKHVKVLARENVDVIFGAVSDKEILPQNHQRNLNRLDPISFFLKSPRCIWSGMILITTGANTLIKRKLFLDVGGFDEQMPRMEDIELGYRLFQHGAKVYYSSEPFAQHKEWQTGGSRKSQKNLPYVRLVSKLYIYKKHFPGWTTKQFVLREILSALLFREYVSAKFRPRHLLQPYLPIVRVFKIFQANLTVNKLLYRASDS